MNTLNIKNITKPNNKITQNKPYIIDSFDPDEGEPEQDYREDQDIQSKQNLVKKQDFLQESKSIFSEENEDERLSIAPSEKELEQELIRGGYVSTTTTNNKNGKNDNYNKINIINNYNSFNNFNNFNNCDAKTKSGISIGYSEKTHKPFKSIDISRKNTQISTPTTSMITDRNVSEFGGIYGSNVNTDYNPKGHNYKYSTSSISSTTQSVTSKTSKYSSTADKQSEKCFLNLEDLMVLEEFLSEILHVRYTNVFYL